MQRGYYILAVTTTTEQPTTTTTPEPTTTTPDWKNICDDEDNQLVDTHNLDKGGWGVAKVSDTLKTMYTHVV